MEESQVLVFGTANGPLRVHIADVDGLEHGDFDQLNQRWRAALRMGSGQTIKLLDYHDLAAVLFDGAKVRWHRRPTP